MREHGVELGANFAAPGRFRVKREGRRLSLSVAF
jgi:hypothetical protein